jgi:AcrR family transcriptional regulator
LLNYYIILSDIECPLITVLVPSIYIFIQIMQGNFEPFESFLSFVAVETKERILVSSQELYFARGVKSVTMEDIASSLGISKKTIYQHFQDKRTLVEASTIYFLEKEECLEKEIYLSSENPIDEIILSTQMMREMLTDINPAIFHDLQKYYPKTWAHYLSHKERWINVIHTNITNGIKQGLYRADINPIILSKLRSESVDMAFNSLVFPTRDFNILEVQLEFVDHFIRGIVSEKGLAVYEQLKNKK